MDATQRPGRREVIVGAAAVVAQVVAGGVRTAAAQTRSRQPDAFEAVRVMVFDTFGTVVDWRSVIIEEGQALNASRGLRVDWAAFADEWRAAYGPSMNRVRTGELPWTKLDVLHRMSLDALLAKHGVTTLTEAEKAELNRAWHRGRPWPDSVAGLTRLRTRFTLAPLSNGNLALLTNMAKHGGLPWDCILGAELVRHYKPDPEVYMSPVEFFDLQPPQVMFVAAHQSDLQVPKKLGLRTAYVHRPYEGGSAGRVELPARGTYDLIVHDLRELATALGV